MIKGLDKFLLHFAGYESRYILIGGVATWLILDEAGLPVRATKDLDIVLCLESLDVDFARAFWEFVREGGYRLQQRSEEKRCFYRFQNPSQKDFPVMLELFSRSPETMVLGDDSHLTPIPVGEDVSSLSAILLDADYYHFMNRQRRLLAGISIVDDYGLIPLKAKAWLDLTERKTRGEAIDSQNIRKHRGDILRLYQVLNPITRINLPKNLRRDLAQFLTQIEPEVDTALLKNLGIQSVTGTEIIGNIKNIYGIDRS